MTERSKKRREFKATVQRPEDLEALRDLWAKLKCLSQETGERSKVCWTLFSKK